MQHTDTVLLETGRSTTSAGYGGLIAMEATTLMTYAALPASAQYAWTDA